jgi:putative hydrolase of the HAD superfamily
MSVRCAGVIFDLFHTLTSRASEWSALPATSELLGIDSRTWNQLLIDRSRWRLAGEERDAVAIVRALAHTFDPGIPEERIREAAQNRIRRFRDALLHVPRENVETLHRMRSAGLRLGLISNADAVEIAAWSECPLAGCFDSEVFSCDAGHVKPEPAIYRQCLEELGLDAGDCIFVGDGGSNELEGARAVGMRPVFISGVTDSLWPEETPARRAAADHEIRTIPELLELLDLVELPGRPAPA